ncbi:MAG: nucleotide-binding domain containing protein, partial [Candidatus Dormibacteraceae bacterium]
AWALGLPPAPRTRAPGCRRPLAIVGSPAAAAQAEHARKAGWRVVLAGPAEVPPLLDADGLLLTGGETAARCLRAHGATGLELLGEPLPRVGYGRLRGGPLAGMPVLLKAGSFGDAATLTRGLAWLTGLEASAEGE